jgi:hypothetical protein
MAGRRAVVLSAAGAGFLLGGCSSGQPAHQEGTSKTVPSTATSAARAQLPRGGRTIFPHYRLVGWCGSPGAPALGELGVGDDLAERVQQMLRASQQYAAAAPAPSSAAGTIPEGASPPPASSGGTPPPVAADKPVLPVVELIATVAQSSPGADGLYRTRVPDHTIATWLHQARRAKALLLLNIQPGRARFLDEATSYEHWLKEPDVGLALDPEWAIGPGQRPGEVFGHTTGQVLNDVAAYLSNIVTTHHLPEKVMVTHVLRTSILTQPQQQHPHHGVAMVTSVDGIGAMAAKIDTYHAVARQLPHHVHPGFKLFFQEDRQAGPLMSPHQVLALHPTPDYVLYE